MKESSGRNVNVSVGYFNDSLMEKMLNIELLSVIISIP